MLQGIAIHGEISNFKRHTTGHLYFTLKDENSRINCVMFRQYAQMLRFLPGDGQRVILSGAVGLYTASGSYQFYGEVMASDGSGALYEQFIKNKERLQKEGLFDASLKKPLPLLPRGIGIVTSSGGAVLHDIITVANRRFPGIPLFLRAAQVQGPGAADDLTKALNEISTLPQVDVIIIGRGGGSLEDLWAFNEENLVRAVAGCQKPVISAVGHETDVTLTDFAADVRAATPSAAAELAVPSQTELNQKISFFVSKLNINSSQRLEQLQTRLQHLHSALRQNDPAYRLNLMGMRLDALLNQMITAINSQIQEMISQAVNMIERFELSGPTKTLKRGYVIALDQGRPIQSIHQVRKELTLQFIDGKVHVRTLKIEQVNER
jgi:exodeoxyribonuclease VII large subunit